jgi:hypothetical protein
MRWFWFRKTAKDYLQEGTQQALRGEGGVGLAAQAQA